MADPLTLETIQGSEAGNYYFVIAKSQFLSLGIRPLVFVKKDGNKTFHLGARLRVVNNDLDGDLMTSATVFNFPEGFTVKDKHASMVCGIPVAEPPFSPTELNLIIKEKNLVTKFAEAILARLNEVDITPLVTQDQLVEILNLTYDTELSEKIKQPIDHTPVFGLK